MSEEILRRLDELKAGQEALKSGQEALTAGQGQILERLTAVEAGLAANTKLLVDVQRSTNENFEIVTRSLEALQPRALRSTG